MNLARARAYNDGEVLARRLTDAHVRALLAVAPLTTLAEATAAYQAAHGLTVDGMAGPQTRAHLDAPAAPVIVEGAPLKHVSRRGRAISLIVLHESVTWTREDAIRVLTRRGLGVHYSIDRDGSVHRHAPDSHACYHAGGAHNRQSVAVEVINRYYGEHADFDALVPIRASWAHKGRYILPTPQQVEAVYQLVVLLLAAHPTIPPVYPGVAGDAFRWGRVEGVRNGIAAHHRWAHADGLVAEHYCWLRSRGLAPAAAWTATVEAASSGERVTLAPGVA